MDAYLSTLCRLISLFTYHLAAFLHALPSIDVTEAKRAIGALNKPRRDEHCRDHERTSCLECH